MLRLRSTYEEIAREARTHRLRILPERQKRTQQGLLLDDVNFDDFDLDKYDKKTILMNENPQNGTQTDNFSVSQRVSESEGLKTPEGEVKQTQTDESEPSIEQEREQERERERSERKSVMSRVYDAMLGEDEFAEVREEMRNRRQQVEQEEGESNEPTVEKQQTEDSDDDLPLNVKKAYEPSSSSSSSSSSSHRSSNRSVQLPIEEEALSEHIRSSSPETVQSSSQSNREQSSSSRQSLDASAEASRSISDGTIEYVDEATPPQSVISSRRSQETIEYIRSRSSSRRSSVQSVSS